MDSTQIQAVFAGLLALSGTSAWWFSRRHREGIETGDSAAASITAIADAAQTLVEPLTRELQRVSVLAESHQSQIASLELHIKILQSQVMELGASPHPAPVSE